MTTLNHTVRQLVVLPTYNEVDNVSTAVESVLRLGDGYGVLVVDDSSPDGTAERVRELVTQHPGRVELVTRAVKDGLGGAYRVGFARALQTQAEVVIQMDADGSHPADRIPLMVDQVRTGAGLVLGSRYVPGGSLDEDWPWSRRAISRGGNVYARSILRLPVKDCTGGFKAWAADVLAGIDLGAADAQGYAFQIQTTLQATRAGTHVVEIPIHFKERVLGTSKMSGRIAAEAMFAVWRMRRR